MNNDVSAPGVLALAEGTTLPPPRAFGESNTLTVPGSRRRRSVDGVVERLVGAAGAAEGAAPVHLAVVPADATPLTLTF